MLAAVMASALLACGGGGGGSVIDGGGVTGFRWRADELLDPNIGVGNTSSGSVAVAADGTGYAVWVRDTATSSQVLARRYNGQAWEPTQVVATAGADVSFEDAQVAQGANGDVVAVWTEAGAASNGAGDRLLSARTVNHQWQGVAVVADTQGTTDISNALLVGDGKGQAVAIWNRTKPADSNAFDVFSSGFQNGGFLPPVQSNADAIDAVVSDLAMDGQGRALMAWVERVAPSAAKLFLQPHVGGVPQLVTQMPVPQGAAIGQAKVALAANRGVAVWAQQATPTSGLTLQYASADDVLAGNWLAPQTLPTAGILDATPSVSLDARGTSTVVWGERVTAVKNLKAVRLGPQALPAQLIETDDRGDVGTPIVATDQQGGVLVVWLQDLNGTGQAANQIFRPFSNRLDPVTNQWGLVETLDTGAPDFSNATALRLGLAPDGRALAVWLDSTSAAGALKANAFN